MDHNKEVEKKIKQIREDYKITFGSEEGKKSFRGHLDKMSWRVRLLSQKITVMRPHFLKDRDQFLYSLKEYLNQNNQ